jgi:hypothetical protein
MKTIKTAISIDEPTFMQVERLAKKLHISRSQFFTQAARHMAGIDENLELLKKINAAYTDPNEDRELSRHEKRYARKKVVEQW